MFDDYFSLKDAFEVKVGDWVEAEVDGEWRWRKVAQTSMTRELLPALVYTFADGEQWMPKTSQKILFSTVDPTGRPNRRKVPEWDEYFLSIATAVSARAKCRRRQVGAVLVGADKRIISTGYAGFPSGVPDCLEGACRRGLTKPGEVPPDSNYNDQNSVGYCLSIHAEQNALLHAGKDTRGATVYITDPPCPECRRSLAGAGVVRAVWPEGELRPIEIYSRG